MKRFLIGCAMVCALWAQGQADSFADPFTVALQVDEAQQIIEIRVEIPAEHYLYDSAYAVKFLTDVEGVEDLGIAPAAVLYDDPFEGETVSVFKRSLVHRWHVERLSLPVSAEVAYQGCNASTCFMPRQRMVSSEPIVPDVAQPAALPAAREDGWLDGLHESGRVTGYLEASEFLAALDGLTETAPAASGLGAFARDPAAFLKHHGMVWTFIIVLIGGLLLNFTPCVLPMIPVNLGIIGAASGGRRGFWLGLAYGAGITVVYGALGIIAVAAGGVFGALQGSPIFSGTVAVIFVLLGLALFDVFAFDFSRLQGSVASGGKSGLVAAAVAGGFSALLAGACVAPVVVAVLILGTSLYGQGVTAGALLPLGLGLGMALPWPLAGLGISFLPKPGRWMESLKHVLGIFVFGLALYYGWLAWQGFRATPVAGSLQAGDKAAWQREVAAAQAEDKPLMVDFWATWCKSCHALEHRTLRDPEVAERLKKYRVVRIQAEQLNEDATKRMAAAFGVRGLPTIIFFDTQQAGTL